ncbi:MAG: glycosyltransferase family 39 protein [bacterium]
MQSKSNNSIIKFISRPYLVILGIIAIIILVGPMLFYNINADPRLIPYFDHDEGYGRDLAWYYYSGEKLESFQYSLDYGVEYRLIVDLIAKPLSLFFVITPNKLLLIIRLFHFICGIFSLYFLWRLTSKHFTSFWIPTVSCLGLIFSPQFLWWLDNVKPEPLLILLIFIGLDYSMRILNNPSWKNLFLAVFCAAFAFMVKLIGLFLLPSIFLSLYLSHLPKKITNLKNQFISLLKHLGVALIILFISLLIFLVIAIPYGSKLYLSMKNAGFDLDKFASNFTPSFSLKLSVYSIIALLLFGCLFSIKFWYKKNKDSINYKKLGVIPLFIISAFIIGYRWFLNIFDWIITYCRWLHQQSEAPLNLFHIHKDGLFQFLNYLFISLKGWFVTFSQKDALGIFGIVLLIIYAFVEIISKSWKDQEERPRFLKRMIIVAFCSFFIIFLIFFQSRFAAHHLIIINILFFILGLEGVRLLHLKTLHNKSLSVAVLFFSIIIISVYLFQHASVAFHWRLMKFKQKEDIVFTISDWWKTTYAYDIQIVSDSPWSVFIPSEFENVIFVKPRLFLDESFRVNSDRLKEIIAKERPKLIFFNEGTRGGESPPALKKFLKDIHLKVVKKFRGNHYRSYLFTGDLFVVYEVVQ